jgi:outer membrane protein assembly factor BamB
LQKIKKIIMIVLISILAITSAASILPAYAVIEEVEVDRFIFAFDPIGVNQLQTISISLDPDLVNVKSVQEEDLLYDARFILTKPDGTNETVEGPFYMDHIFSHYLIFEFTPDQVGTWTIQFEWDGDPLYYTSTSAELTFEVQATPVDLVRDVDPWLFVRPNPIGVGQSLLVELGVVPRPKLPGDEYDDYYIEFTKPDGTTYTEGPIKSYQDSTQWFEYTPDQVGTWTIQFIWDGDKYENPIDQPEITLTVQDAPIPMWPGVQLPTDKPLEFPVNIFNREWAELSGPWLLNTGRFSQYDNSRSNFNPYSKAPRSSHILWILPPLEGVGGQVGGPYGTGVYYDQSSLEFKAVIAGRGYWTGGGQIHCVDIRSGEEMWAVDGGFDFSSIEVEDPDEAFPILVSIRTPRGRLIKYDALTGEKILDVPNFQGTRDWDNIIIDPVGGYIVDADRDETQMIKYTFFGDTEFFEDRIIWNITYPWEGPANHDLKMGMDFEANAIINLSYDIYVTAGGVDYTTGELLWKRYVSGIQSRNSNGFGYGNVYHTVDGRMIRALDGRTGTVKWTSEPAAEPWGNYWAYEHAAAYDTIYKPGYAGLHAFDPENGDLKWVFSSGDAGYETPYGTWPFYGAVIVADEIVFCVTSEHSPTLPIYRGQKLFAVDAIEGTEVWSLTSNINAYMVAEGTLFGTDMYDGRSFAFNKGETATTVSVSEKVIEQGSSVLIEGSIMDMSPAQPNTPAVSDASMSAWMEYLHMQQPFPESAEGVEVLLTTNDPNGNNVDIATVVSDLNGNFKSLWTPEIPGEYTVIAAFEGSESYYSSSAATFFGVTEAPEPTPPEPTPIPADLTDTYIMGMGAAAIVVIIIFGLLILLMLRKR